MERLFSDDVTGAQPRAGWSRRQLLIGLGRGAALAVASSSIAVLVSACGGAPATPTPGTTAPTQAPSTSAQPTQAANNAQPTQAAAAPAATAAPNSAVKGKITFSWWGTGERNTKTQAVIDLFQKKYPGTSIQGVSVGDFTTYWQKLTVQAAARNLPDVPQMQVRYMSAYDTRGALKELDDLTKSGEIDITGIPKVIADSGRGPQDKLYMVPTGAATNNWMYNDTMISTAGLASPTTLKNWDDIQKWLLSAKDKLPSGTYAIDLRGSDDSLWWAWMATNGKPVFNDDGTLGFPKQLMIDFWNWWETLLKGGATVPAAMNQEEPTSNVQRYLALGKVMFDEAPSNQLGAYQTALTSAGKGTMKVTSFPNTSSGNGQVLINSGMSIAANTTNLPAAAAWVNFFANDPDGAKVYASDNGAVTATKLLQTQIDEPNQDATHKEYLQFIKSVIDGKPTIVHFPINYNAVVLALTNNFSNVAFGKATVEAAVDAFFSAANAAASG